MHENDRVLLVVREWVQKAENDLKNAVNTLKMGEDCPTDTVCFHAQQCVEKYLKAFLVSRDIDFPRTHDIGDLVDLMPRNIRIRLSVEEQQRLTAYATTMRYPGEYEPLSLAQARKAVAIARRVRGELRAILSRKILRQGGN
ncbi:MAG: HEPN domain-containing protein [Bacteroidota bacterium]